MNQKTLSKEEFNALCFCYQTGNYSEQEHIVDQLLNQHIFISFETVLHCFHDKNNFDDLQTLYKLLRYVHWQSEAERLEVVSLLKHHSLKSLSPEQRRLALDALGWVLYGIDQDIEAELLLLLFDEEADVRVEAIKFLGQDGNEKALACIALLLDDPDEMVQFESVNTLDFMAITMPFARFILSEWEKRK